MFNEQHARALAANRIVSGADEGGLVESFVQICRFLHENPDRFSWRGANPPSTSNEDGLERLLTRYLEAYRRIDRPAIVQTVPDPMVGVVMRSVWGHSPEQHAAAARSHQQAMSAENVIGAMLERYLDSVLRPHGWHWCCGSFVRAIDFLYKRPDGQWFALQVKNRDNSENSSSSAIRLGTEIQKWFRSRSRTGASNWENLPPMMQGKGLSEEGFREFTKSYLQRHG